MEKQLEYFDAVANTQKQALSNIVGVQNDLRTQWLDSLGKVRDAVTSMPGLTATPQTLNHFNSWFGNVLSATHTACAEAKKTQENWVGAFEKQVEINREAFKTFIDIANTANTQKA